MTHFLTVCERGNVRSVTCAIILKDLYMQDDVIPMGVTTTSDETLGMLMDWATRIYIVGTVRGIERLDTVTHLNTTHLDVGVDSWGQPMNPELVSMIIAELQSKAGFANVQTRLPVELYQQLNSDAFHRRFT